MLITTRTAIQNNKNRKMGDYSQCRRQVGVCSISSSSNNNNNYFMELEVLNLKKDKGATRKNKNLCVKMVTFQFVVAEIFADVIIIKIDKFSILDLIIIEC